MAGLVAGIFFLSAILAAGLYFLRNKAQKVSEVEAAKTAQRQEQPLMNEPIIPYSSAYGSNIQNWILLIESTLQNRNSPVPSIIGKMF